MALTDRLSGFRAAALIALVVLVSACEKAEQKGPGTAAAPEPAAEGAKPALGEAEVSVTNGRVTVVCQAAPRGLLLEKLARQAGFELTGELDARPLTLDLKAQPLEPVIAVLLQDLPYRAQWKYNATTDRHALSRLEVGEIAVVPESPEVAAERAKRRAMADSLRAQAREQREKGVSEEQKAELAARREERARSQADLLEQLRSSNPDMRIEAVEGLEPDGPALEAVLDVLKNDPDARVRQKAAAQAGEGDGFLACSGLIESLGDRDSAVVLQALDSLEFTCDETVAPLVRQRCAQSADPDVKARCAEAIDFMQ